MTPAGSGEAGLRTVAVRKSFGARHVLDGVDLEVPAGSITAVLGRSGGGKTTLLRLIAGFERPDDGTITVGGVVVASPSQWVPAERRRIGIVPQEGALFPHLSVGQNVAFGLKRSPAAKARVVECLDLVGLADRIDARPQHLSGGEQQRVALARALAPEPSLVLLDEPFAALDATMRSHVRDEACAALRRAGATAVLVTHDQQEALAVADQIAVLADGRIVQSAPPEVVYGQPADLAVASFFGDSIVLPGRRDGTAVECALGVLDVHPASPPSGVEVLIVVRPEQLRLGGSVGRPGAVTARMVHAAFLGHESLVQLAVDGGSGRGREPLELTVRLHRRDVPSNHAAVVVEVDGPVMVFAPS